MIENAKIQETKILSEGHHYPLKKVTFSYKDKEGDWKEKTHEVYHLGNAAVVLLYNKKEKKVLLTRQFRIPSYLNNAAEGMLVEACAGKLENESAEEGMKREVEEETGYKVPALQKIFEAYMSPGYVTEKIHFFIAGYDASMKVSEGGGLKEEEEDIEVLELPFTEALEQMNNGKIKDAKTIMLLQYAQLHRLLDSE